MLTEAKLLLERIVRERTHIKKIAFRKSTEDDFRTQKSLPYVTIYSADGRFDESTNRVMRIKNLQYVQVRGTRYVPLEIKIAAATESEAAAMLGEVIRYLPLKWLIGQWQGRLKIVSEHYDDYSSSAKDLAHASCFVLMSMEVGTDPAPVARITDIVVAPER